jgi:hypothetical protein
MSIETLDTLIDTAETKVEVLKATAAFVAMMNEKFMAEMEDFHIDTIGSRYIKIAQGSRKYLKEGQEPSRSVHAFVDAMTGDLLMPAGWKAPAKGARGNILDEAQRATIVAGADRFGGYLYKRR